MSVCIRENSSPNQLRRLKHALYWISHPEEEVENRRFNAPKRTRRLLDRICPLTKEVQS